VNKSQDNRKILNKKLDILTVFDYYRQVEQSFYLFYTKFFELNFDIHEHKL